MAYNELNRMQNTENETPTDLSQGAQGSVDEIPNVTQKVQAAAEGNDPFSQLITAGGKLITESGKDYGSGVMPSDSRYDIVDGMYDAGKKVQSVAQAVGQEKRIRATAPEDINRRFLNQVGEVNMYGDEMGNNHEALEQNLENMHNLDQNGEVAKNISEMPTQGLAKLYDTLLQHARNKVNDYEQAPLRKDTVYQMNRALHELHRRGYNTAVFDPHDDPEHRQTGIDLETKEHASRFHGFHENFEDHLERTRKFQKGLIHRDEAHQAPPTMIDNGFDLTENGTRDRANRFAHQDNMQVEHRIQSQMVANQEAAAREIALRNLERNPGGDFNEMLTNARHEVATHYVNETQDVFNRISGDPQAQRSHIREARQTHFYATQLSRIHSMDANRIGYDLPPVHDRFDFSEYGPLGRGDEGLRQHRLLNDVLFTQRDKSLMGLPITHPVVQGLSPDEINELATRSQSTLISREGGDPIEPQGDLGRLRYGDAEPRQPAPRGRRRGFFANLFHREQPYELIDPEPLEIPPVPQERRRGGIMGLLDRFRGRGRGRGGYGRTEDESSDIGDVGRSLLASDDSDEGSLGAIHALSGTPPIPPRRRRSHRPRGGSANPFSSSDSGSDSGSSASSASSGGMFL